MRLKRVKSNVFTQNIIIMTAASTLVRIIGLYLNSIAARGIGAEGMGLYGLASSVYILASGLSVSGMTAAVTRINSQELAKGDKETSRGGMKCCLYVSLVLSLMSSVFLSALSTVIAKYQIGNVQAAKSLCVFSMAIPFVSISAILRGWYTSGKNTIKPSSAMVFEQIVRMTMYLVFIPESLNDSANGCLILAISDLAAEFFGCLFLIFLYAFSKKTKSRKPDEIRKRIAENAVPVTASFYFTSTLRTIETSVIPMCLVMYGMSRSDAVSQLGIVHSMALPLLFFPSSLLTSAGALLTPEMVEYKIAENEKKLKSAAEKAIRMTLMCAVPIGVLFLMCGQQLSMLLYGESKAAQAIGVLAPLIPLMYCETLCSGLLRGMGEQNRLLIYNIIDGGVRLILVFLLVPRIGIWGFYAVMIVSNILTPLLCLGRFGKVTGADGITKTLVTYSIRALIAWGVCAVCKKALPNLFGKAELLECLIFTVIYILLSLDSRLLQGSEVHLVCWKIRKSVQCIFCRQAHADGREAHHARRSRCGSRNRCTDKELLHP